MVRGVRSVARVCTHLHYRLSWGAENLAPCGKPVYRTTNWRTIYRVPRRTSTGAGVTGVRRRVDRQLSGRVPIEILKRYEKWKDIARLSGPQGLRAIKGFNDEALAGEWKGHRSSRLGLQWRVIYRVVAEVLLIQVVLQVTPHDSRKP